jgi:hypothetical protein
MARPDLRLVLALVALLSGCSIVVGEITPPPCTADSECEILNRTPPDGKVITGCRRYQCTGNPASPGTCVYRPTDADDDGQVAAMCPNGTDCDDTNPTIGENLPELCDGLDNDCDLVIDDGDFSGAGPEGVGTATGVTELTWGESGSGSYTSTGPTTAFRFRDGRLESAVIMPRTNPVPSYNNLANPAQAVPGCLTKATTYLVPDPARDGGGLCATDDDCIQAVCVRNDGGTVGECPDPAGSGTVTCSSDDQCSELCVSGRCVPPSLLGGATILRSDVQASMNCNLSDLATAPVGSLGSFAAGVSTQGCGAGILRAGWLGSDGASLSLYGPEARSNIWLGVDVGAFSDIRDGGTATIACSGASRGQPGASRPAVSALASVRDPQALVAYLGAPLRVGDGTAPRARCAAPSTSAPVEVLGLFKEFGGDSAALKDWVTASNDGRPEALGETAGVGAPAVRSVADAGWVVAYPEATAAGATPIALHFLGRMTPPAPFAVTMAGGVAVPAKVARPTQPLAPTEAFVTVPAGGRADFVRLALGAERGGVQDVGVVWMEDCSVNGDMDMVSPTETVWFALVRFDPTMPGGATVTAPIQLSTPRAPGGRPMVAWAGPGVSFVSPGWARGDGEPVAGDRRGGFVVAWAGAAADEPRDALYAVRVSESDGLPVDDAPLALPVITADGVTIPVEAASLYETHEDAAGRVSFGALDGRDGFVGGRLVCPPAL